MGLHSVHAYLLLSFLCYDMQFLFLWYAMRYKTFYHNLCVIMLWYLIKHIQYTKKSNVYYQFVNQSVSSELERSFYCFESLYLFKPLCYLLCKITWINMLLYLTLNLFSWYLPIVNSQNHPIAPFEFPHF